MVDSPMHTMGDKGGGQEIQIKLCKYLIQFVIPIHLHLQRSIS